MFHNVIVAKMLCFTVTLPVWGQSPSACWCLQDEDLATDPSHWAPRFEFPNDCPTKGFYAGVLCLFMVRTKEILQRCQVGAPVPFIVVMSLCFYCCMLTKQLLRLRPKGKNVKVVFSGAAFLARWHVSPPNSPTQGQSLLASQKLEPGSCLHLCSDHTRAKAVISSWWPWGGVPCSPFFITSF